VRADLDLDDLSLRVLPVRRIVVGVEREQAQPRTIAEGDRAEPAGDAQAVKAATVRAHAREDRLPPKSRIPIELVPRHRGELPKRREDLALQVLLEREKSLLEFGAVEVEPDRFAD
jgi:hypothetical protein